MTARFDISQMGDHSDCASIDKNNKKWIKEDSERNAEIGITHKSLYSYIHPESIPTTSMGKVSQ